MLTLRSTKATVTDSRGHYKTRSGAVYHAIRRPLPGKRRRATDTGAAAGGSAESPSAAPLGHGISMTCRSSWRIRAPLSSIGGVPREAAVAGICGAVLRRATVRLTGTRPVEEQGVRCASPMQLKGQGTAVAFDAVSWAVFSPAISRRGLSGAIPPAKGRSLGDPFRTSAASEETALVAWNELRGSFQGVSKTVAAVEVGFHETCRRCRIMRGGPCLAGEGNSVGSGIGRARPGLHRRGLVHPPGGTSRCAPGLQGSCILATVTCRATAHAVFVLP